MRKLLLIALSLLMIINCCAQKRNIKKVTPKKKYKMEIPNITKDNLEIPNLIDLINQENKKILNKTSDSSRILKANNFQDYGFSIQKDENNFEYYKYKNGLINHIQKNVKDNLPPIPRKQKYFNDSGIFTQTIQTYIDFYPNNSISKIRQYNDTSNGAYPAGNWYVYDETGNLLQHIDHEKHFRMSYYDVAKIADSYQYTFTSSEGVKSFYSYPSIKIMRTFNETKSYWQIIFERYQDDEFSSRYIFIDDKTGKEIYDMSQEEFHNFRGFDDMAEYQKNLYKLFKPN